MTRDLYKRIILYCFLFGTYGCYLAADLLPMPLLLGMSTISFALFWYQHINEPRWVRTLGLLVISVPVSFLSISGGSYADLPFSWFNLFQFVFIIDGILSSRMKPNSLSMAATFFGALMIPALLYSPDIIAGAKQYINIFTTIACIWVVSGRVKEIEYSRLKWFLRLYVAATVSTAILILIQWALLARLGIQLGSEIAVGSGRQILAGAFNDPSFLSLYLATGIIIVIFDAPNGLTPALFAAGSLLCLGAVLCSARTGAAALIGAVGFYVLGRAFLYHRAQPKLLFVTLLIAAGTVAGLMLGRSDIGGDSGRFETYQVGLSHFLASPTFGIGLGVRTYYLITGTAIPHNLIIQYLAQSGIVGMLGLTVFSLESLRVSLKVDPRLFTGILCCFIGSFFVPDMINSRFFLVFLLFTVISMNVKRDASSPALNNA
jgi:hypothetical protein